MRRAVLFDAFGTLFSVEPLQRKLRASGLEAWFERLLHSATSLTLAGQYAPFAELAESTLKTTIAKLGLKQDPKQILELLQTLTAGSVLDVGCGSGVLSIGAAKLGFAPVIGLDLDDASVEATLANARVNGVTVDARRADALTDRLPQTDVVVANVALDVVERLLPRLRSSLVVTSGYLDRDRPQVEGWEHAGRRERDGWAADLLRLSA